MNKVPDSMNMGQLLTYTTDLAYKYRDCSAKHEALIKYAQ